MSTKETSTSHKGELFPSRMWHSIEVVFETIFVGVYRLVCGYVRDLLLYTRDAKVVVAEGSSVIHLGIANDVQSF